MRTRIVLTLVFLGILFGCTQRELSRREAASLIQEKMHAIPEVQVRLTEQGFRQGEQQGFWNQRGSLSEAGKKYFSQNVAFSTVTLRQPVKKNLLEVTGIADAVLPFSSASKDGIKEVQFTWEYADVQPIPRRLIVRGGTGDALLRRYDDGWRVEHVEIRSSDKPFTLSSEEQRGAEEDVRAEEDRKRVEEETRRADAARWNQLVSQATTPTREAGRCRTADNYNRASEELIITDVGATVIKSSFRGTLPFANVKNITTSMYGTSLSIEYSFVERSSDFGYGDRFVSVFLDGAERDRCYHLVVTAYNSWTSKFPQLAGVGIRGIQRR